MTLCLGAMLNNNIATKRHENVVLKKEGRVPPLVEQFGWEPVWEFLVGEHTA